MTMNLGFIGLGIMGKPMTLNLLKGGHKLRVHGRRPETMKPLVAAGAQACASPQAAAEGADVIFIMVSDTPDVEHVMFGEHGVIHGAGRGSAVVDMSSISPIATQAMAKKLAEKGVDMLDAPVSGGEAGAVSGSLSIMVGGKAAAFARVLPLFQLMGKNIVHVGDHGAGQTAKVCNQMVVAQTIAAVSEAMIFASKAGVDPAKVRQALLGGFAGSKILEVHGQRMLERNFKPGFKAKLHQKDIRIALLAAHELGLALPGTAMASTYLNALVGSDDGELDSSAMVKILERMSGVQVKQAESK
ncbi:MAG TPA: 2-hydroxy-3-oxopropionate reductase [Acidiferrobacterales bacterium]|nr:2-hydroxy-3-oxopropionate reductase [Acidiferrobacterales bacterium]